MEDTKYYSLTTRHFTLRCNHREWLESTQLFYNQILLFYYHLFLDLVEAGGRDADNSNTSTERDIKQPDRDISRLNSQQLLRELEKRSIAGRDKKPVSHPLPWSRVPLYFRRAAANAGIAAGKSFLVREEQQLRTEAFHESVTFYKGTYRDFDDTGITLRVWTGEKWSWLRCRLASGRADKGQETEILSPSVVLKPKGISLHVPVRERVEKVGNARKSMGEGTRLCSVQFTNGDSIAVCTALDREGKVLAVRFLKGGSRYRHSCKRILEKLEKSKDSTAGQGRQENLEASTVEQHVLKPNQKYWLKLQNISVSCAHQISRRIIDFAGEKDCGVIVLPKYEERYSRIVMKAVGNWSSLHLSNRIRSQLSYKAWRRGILVLEADAKNTGGSCAVCGAPVKKSGDEFRCPNGHKGSRYVNTCVNLGRKCRESFQRNSRAFRV